VWHVSTPNEDHQFTVAAVIYSPQKDYNTWLRDH